MNDDRTFTLDAETTEKLTAFGELLNKDASTMINEALEQYFEAKEEEIVRQDPRTNLSYDEFWDDMEVE